jgi:CBS domain-containing protein
VVDADGELIGMVSEGDLVVDRFGHDPRSQLRPVEDEPPGPQTVAEVMTRTVIALGPSADAADLAQTMLDSDVRSIPIVEGPTVMGIVSRRDLLRTLIRGDDALRTEVLDRLATHRETYNEPTDTWDVQVTDGAVLLVGDFDDAHGRAALATARTIPGVTAAKLIHRQTAAHS